MNRVVFVGHKRFDKHRKRTFTVAVWKVEHGRRKPASLWGDELAAGWDAYRRENAPVALPPATKPTPAIETTVRKRVYVGAAPAATNVRPLADRVISAACLAFSQDEDAVRSTCKVPALLMPRYLAMMMLRRKLGETYAQIGERFSGRNPSVVMRAIEKAEVMAVESGIFACAIASVEAECFETGDDA